MSTIRKKRALVLSGGGNRGAYEVGVLKHLIIDKGYRYDAIIGVSAGALNATFLGNYNIADQAKGVRDLELMWLDIQQKNVYKPWFNSYTLSFLSALFGIKESFLNTEPLSKFIDEHYFNVSNSNVDVIVGVTRLHDGKFELVNKTEPKFKDFVLASASIPMIFPSKIINNVQYVDGGIRENTPLKDVINDNQYEYVDVVILVPTEENFKYEKKKLHNIYQIGYRTVNILAHKVLYSEVNSINTKHMIEVMHECHAQINLFAPKVNLMSGKGVLQILSFNKKNTKKIIEMGYLNTVDYFQSKK